MFSMKTWRLHRILVVYYDIGNELQLSTVYKYSVM